MPRVAYTWPHLIWLEGKKREMRGDQNTKNVLYCQDIMAGMRNVEKHTETYRNQKLSASQAEGRGFESRFPLQEIKGLGH